MAPRHATYPEGVPHTPVPSVTTAPISLHEEQAGRMRQYLATMALRTACFIAMVVLPGWWRLGALVGAAVLPMVAVMAANAVDHRRPEPVPSDEEQTPLALGAGEVIKATVVEVAQSEGNR